MASSRDKLVIGTRGSKLALWQSEYIKGRLEEITGLPVELTIIKTTGDKILDVPLAKVGGKGLFTKEIEVELARGQRRPRGPLDEGRSHRASRGLRASRDAAARRPARRARVAVAGYTLDDAARGRDARHHSLRRIAARSARYQARLEIVDVRGNLDTRMRKAEDGEVDAVILAAAGITRMGWADRITHYIDPES